MTQTTLPTGFEDLSLCLDWNLPTADQRQRKRQASSAAELRTFYDRMLPRLSDALAEVDRFPLGALPESHHALYNLALSLAEVAPHIELYSGSPASPMRSRKRVSSPSMAGRRHGAGCTRWPPDNGPPAHGGTAVPHRSAPGDGRSRGALRPRRGPEERPGDHATAVPRGRHLVGGGLRHLPRRRRDCPGPRPHRRRTGAMVDPLYGRPLCRIYGRRPLGALPLVSLGTVHHGRGLRPGRSLAGRLVRQPDNL